MPRLPRLPILVLLLTLPMMAWAQAGPALGPARRVFPEIGAGARGIRRGPDGRYYVLMSPGAAVLVFDSDGKKLGQVPAKAVGAAAIVFGAALDVDSSGRIYVADRGGNAVNIYAADGTLAAHVRVPAPVGIAALPRDEFAVSCANAGHLISVYDFRGTLLREFGDPVSPTGDPSLNRGLNLGYLASDADGNLYFAFEYLPEPTVRKYDAYGYLGDEFSFKDQDFEAAEQTALRELDRAKTGDTVAPQQIISAMGVDPATQEVWIAVGGVLAHADRDGRQIDTQPIDTPAGARLDPTFVFIEPGRLLLGSDSLGIYEAPRLPGGAKPR